LEAHAAATLDIFQYQEILISRGSVMDISQYRQSDVIPSRILLALGVAKRPRPLAAGDQATEPDLIAIMSVGITRSWQGEICQYPQFRSA
jgi:hypothetical protein